MTQDTLTVTQTLEDQIETPTPSVSLIVLEADAAGDDQQVRATISDDTGHTKVIAFPVEGLAPNLSECLPLTAAIRAVDVLEHVTDDERWIENLASQLVRGGTLTIRLPLEGPMAWLDALNMYRYVQDTIGVGKDLDETRLKGWHRHYQVDEVVRMIEESGLDVTSIVRSGSPHVEAVRFVGLAWGVIRNRELRAESQLQRWGKEAGVRTSHLRLGRCSTWVTIEAQKT